jgi:hypothetical protein
MAMFISKNSEGKWQKERSFVLLKKSNLNQDMWQRAKGGGKAALRKSQR